jgi:hypothetical protein
VLVEGQAFNPDVWRVYLYYGSTGSPSNQAVTISVGATVTGCAWIVFDLPGADTTSPIGDDQGFGSVTPDTQITRNIVVSPAGGMAIAAVGTNVDSGLTATGGTELEEVTMSSPTASLGVYYNSSTDDIGAIFASANAGMASSEFLEAGAVADTSRLMLLGVG